MQGAENASRNSEIYKNTQTACRKIAACCLSALSAKNGFARFLLGTNKGVRFPVSPRISVAGPQNIDFHPDDLNNFQTAGNYFQAIGKITIGRGTYIAPNVGLITANHDPADLDRHLPPKPIVLGENVGSV